MWNNEYLLFIWLFPLAFEIVLPLIILCSWSLYKLPNLIFKVLGLSSNPKPELYSIG